MIRRVVLISVVLFLSFANGPEQCIGQPPDQLQQTKRNIQSLIEAGKHTEARSATNKLAIDFAGRPELPETLYWIAEKYRWSSEFEQAKPIYLEIIQKYSSSPYVRRARLGFARADVLSLIVSGDYDKARKALDKLTADFASNPDMAETLYWIAERYERSSKFEEAKPVYQQVIERYPRDRYAKKARLGFSKSEVMSLITAKEYERADRALVKLAIDLTGNPDLPEALYWITERFERASRFEDAKRNYQRIMQSYPRSAWAGKARLGLARANVMSLIVSKDFDGARAALDKLTADFAGSPDLPGVLYWITERYVWVERFDEAKRVCQQILQNHPDSPYASRAQLRVSIADVMSLIASENYNGAETALDKLVVDSKYHPDLPRAVLIIGEKYYRERKAKDSVERAKRAFQIITEKLPVNPLTPEACCWAGDSCTELSQYEEAIRYYKRSCDGFPQYGCTPGSRSDDAFRWRSLYMIGQSYQKLIEAGQISKEQAEPLIIDSYERLLREFGNCELAKDAWRELGWLHDRNSRRSDAVRCFEEYLKLVPEGRRPPDVFYELGRAYDEMGNIESAKKNYKLFLNSVLPNDPRRKEVKAWLAATEKTD